MSEKWQIRFYQMEVQSLYKLHRVLGEFISRTNRCYKDTAFAEMKDEKHDYHSLITLFPSVS